MTDRKYLDSQSVQLLAPVDLNECNKENAMYYLDKEQEQVLLQVRELIQRMKRHQSAGSSATIYYLAQP